MEKYLVTTVNPFFAPDGNKYSAIWGDFDILNMESKNPFWTLGINIKVGNNNNHMIISKEQIQSAVICKEKPVSIKDIWMTE